MSAAVSGVKDLFQRLEEQQVAEEKAGVSEAIIEPNQESEVIVVGAKNSGKSSLILGFVNKADVPKPTTALEYKFARFSSKEGSKVIIANIWELAGDTQLAQLLDVVLAPAKLARSQVVIVADLSKPGDVLRTVNYWLDAVRARVEACTREMRKNESGLAALKQLEARLPAATSPEVRPVGIPVLIVGSKFDEFEKQSQASTEFLQVMAKTLRYVAHSNYASLVYTREKDKVRGAAHAAPVSRAGCAGVARGRSLEGAGQRDASVCERACAPLVAVTFARASRQHLWPQCCRRGRHQRPQRHLPSRPLASPASPTHPPEPARAPPLPRPRRALLRPPNRPRRCSAR